MPDRDPEGPIIVWEDFGCEGWHPKSYPSIAAAIAQHRGANGKVVTRLLTVKDFIKEDDHT